MYYYDPNNDKSNARRWAGLAALLYALSIAAGFPVVAVELGAGGEEPPNPLSPQPTAIKP